MTFSGDVSGALSAITSALQIAGLNYDDPREGTIDANADVEIKADGAASVKTIVTLTRIDKAGYDKILDSAEMKEDGKKHLPNAPDADGDGVADDTGGKLAKSAGGAGKVTKPPKTS